jgi:hypothetical protein
LVVISLSIPYYFLSLSSMSFFSQIGSAWDEICFMLIRPPRVEYDIVDLGPMEFTIAGKQYKRVDLELKNERNLTLQCSHYLSKEDPNNEKTPCIVRKIIF